MMSGKVQRILVVDDVPTNIGVLNEILKNDYSISAATSGAEALRIAQSENPPDLILLDIMMPEMDGFEVMTRLKEDNRTRSIPVILVTAKGEMDSRMRGFDLGVEFYITKPVDPVYVRDVVKKTLL